MNTLPDKPSALIRVALCDLRKVEQDPKFRVDMTRWMYRDNVVCYVCLAGAVMAQSLGIMGMVSEELTPIETFILDAESDKLRALNEFRAGRVNSGLFVMGLPHHGWHVELITPYHVNKDRFHSDMRRLADKLEEAGL